MKIPLSWLNEYVKVTDIPLQRLRQQCDLAGLEIGGIEAIGHSEAELPWDPEKILTAEIVAVRPHPDADRLVLGEVNYGGAENEVVVTGAPSLLAYMGQEDLHLKVAFAWEGAILYDGHSEGWKKSKLKATKIRGVRSRAMVCSEKELGLAEEQTDIIYLPDDTPVGVPLVEVLGDYVLDFDIKGPFGHLQSVYGIAREVAALLDRPLNREPFQAVANLGLETAPETDFIELEIADPDLCPRYTATMIRDIVIGPSPLWMQMRLKRAGMRPINNIVDITNYVMLELGQPLHAFDYAYLRSRQDTFAPKRSGGLPTEASPSDTDTFAPKRSGGLPTEASLSSVKPTIIVRRAHEGESMRTLDNELRTFDDEMLLITDGGGPVAIGGVMGGLDSEVEEQTENVLLEAASFNFINIRRTSQLLKLSTEASSHFGKRVDPELALVAAARAAELMAQLAGGTVDPRVGDVYPGKPEPVSITYDPALADRILGIEIAPAEQQRILAALEFEVDRSPMTGTQGDEGQVWHVGVPSYRQDVRRPVDLVEDIARIWGYDRFPHTLIEEELPPLRRNLSLEGEDQVRDILVGLGLDEVIVYSLIDPEDEMRLHPNAARSVDLPGEPVVLRNALAPERSQMRRTLLPGLLRTAWDNLRFLDRVAIFELGHVHYKVGEPDVEAAETGIAEPRRLGILLTGPRQDRWWEPTDREPMDYFDLKGVVDALLSRLDLKHTVQWERGKHPSFHPGRCAKVSLDGQALGYIGELHPLVGEVFDLPEQPVVLMEWDLDALLEAAWAAEAEKELGWVSTYPQVHEDLALVVDEDVPALDVQRALLEIGAPLVTRALLFDTYRGPQVGKGRKSLAFALTYQAPDRALRDRDVTKLRKRLIKRIEQQVGATLRGPQ